MTPNLTAVDAAVAQLRAAHAREPHPSARVRRDWLRAIAHELGARREALYAAARADLNKPEVETELTELSLCRREALWMARQVSRWARPQRVTSSLFTFPSRSRIVAEPRGVVAVFGTWNYPIRLTLGPVLAALAAGNRVLLKPSERAPATGSALATLLRAALGDDVVSVVEGDVGVSREILRHRFDLFFYTGGPAGGRAVAHAAAEQLAPVVLELGGKSPGIIHRSAHIGRAAERIAWGKFVNAGQTCIAPDYVLVERSQHDAFVAALVQTLQRSYPDSARVARDYARIVSAGRFDALAALAATPGAIRIGDADRTSLCLPPVIIPNASWDHPVMREEIFGPVLPVVAYDNFDDALREVAARSSPLAVYLFSESRAVTERVRKATRSGAIVVNDTVRHLSNLRLPFGGVGASGFGRYHGYFGFETFSHFRPVVERPSWWRLFDLHPPYGEYAERVRRWMS